MCGGEYKHWETPRQLSKICGEEIVARTIRLLKECGVKDINISSNNPKFEGFGVPVLKHYNPFVVNEEFRDEQGDWFYAFYPTDEPTCYLFGDVVFSPEAIKTIVETEVDDIQLFASGKPFAENYIKKHEEPFALKVMKPEHLKNSIEKARELNKQNKFWRSPMVWELFTVIKNAPLQTKRDQYTTDYFVINDYTCDVDRMNDIILLNNLLGGKNMVRCKVIERFSLKDFDKLQNIKRASVDEKGILQVDDEFECDEQLAKYLLGANRMERPFIKVIEVMVKEVETPNAVEVKIEKVEEKPKSAKPKKKAKKSKK